MLVRATRLDGFVSHLQCIDGESTLASRPDKSTAIFTGPVPTVSLVAEQPHRVHSKA